MGERFRKQENRLVNRRIAQINVKRAMIAGVIAALLVPFIMIFGSGISAEYGSFTTMMIVFEVLCFGFVGLNVLSMKTENFKLGILSYRCFWAVFEGFSFYITYVSSSSGAGVGFYSVMLCVLTLIPLLSITEMAYGIAAELIFILCLSIKSEAGGMEIFNILVLNAVLISVSRAIYTHMREFIAMKDTISEKTNRSLTDVPTGLMNSKGFEKGAYHSFLSSIKHNRNAAIIMIDIDDLRNINTVLGSRTGDECIKTVAGIIRSLVAKYSNVCARIDGGKFAVFMECSSSEEAVRAGEKIRTMVASKRLASVSGGNADFLTVSVGIASFVPEDEREFALLYEEAEDSLIEAKTNGKNLTIFEDRGFGTLKKAN